MLLISCNTDVQEDAEGLWCLGKIKGLVKPELPKT